MTKKSNEELTLVVVESPAKAKTIGKYLGPNFIVEASKGHVVDLLKSKKYPLGVDIDGGFIPKYGVLEEKNGTVQKIIDAAEKCSNILLAPDPDREGEAIAWHIAWCLESLNKPIKRVLFHEITKKEILKAVAAPQELDRQLYDAQQARRIIDRIVGFKVSPFLMEKVGGKLSAGRVQSVAVRLVVDREREIENFKPEEYWNITAQLAKQSNLSDSFTSKYTGKVPNKQLADKIKADLDISTYKVTSVEAKQKLRNPYPPFTTSRLLQAAAGRYGFAAARTSKAAQTLYENGFCTYIRTDSVRSSPESISDLRSWLSGNKYDIPDTQNYYKNKDSAQDAHEAIRPTDINLLSGLLIGSDDEKKIYKLIWERFVASQMKPAIYDTMVVLIEASKGQHELKATGSTIRYKGWLAISEDFDSSKKDEDDEIKLPILKEKESLDLVDPKVVAEQKFTQPPPRYSEQSLIKELEKRGIGRPSTYPTIMTKITDKDYVERKKNTFFGTSLGKLVVDLLVKHFGFMQYEYTADMETQLDLIAEDKLKYLTMMNSFYSPFVKQLGDAKTASEKPTGFNCDKCSNPMVLKRSKFGTFLACSTYPECKGTKPCAVDGENITLVERIKEQPVLVTGINCPKCKGGMVKRDGKFGSFLGCANYPKCNGISRVPFGKKCPKCNDELSLISFNGDEKLSCMAYPNCKYIEELPGATPKKKFFKKFKKN